MARRSGLKRQVIYRRAPGIDGFDGFAVVGGHPALIFAPTNSGGFENDDSFSSDVAAVVTRCGRDNGRRREILLPALALPNNAVGRDAAGDHRGSGVFRAGMK
jgi:hypothetical protein